MVPGNRKNELKALFSGAPAAAPEVKSAVPPSGGEAVSTPPRTASGAIKAMGLTLGAITREAEEARALRLALNDGDRILSVDPELVDSSFIEDRLTIEDRDDDDFEALVESIRESGQQVPILLRPHPEREGRYQTAYGHRRLKAVRRLGRPVQAIVRPLSDDELVLAQGKENAERRNLSFIERALFAKALIERGFDRKVAGDALAVQKSELSRLLQVAEGVPEGVARAIGPALKAGRDRWMAMGTLLASEAGQAKARDEIFSQRFREADSDRRFQLVFNRLSRSSKPAPVKPQELKDRNGRVFARLVREGRAPRIEFLPGIDPEFLDRAADLLAQHYTAAQSKAGG